MLKNSLLLLLVLVSIFACTAQTNIIIEPKGLYAGIDLTEQNAMISKLVESSTRAAAIDTIFKYFSRYNPPVLYLFSEALFVQGEFQNGLEWYLFAQLNALYDAKRCADKTARQATIILETKYKPIFAKYIKKNKKTFKESVYRVVDLFNKVQQDYDYRWINLHGMDAIISSYDTTENKSQILSLPQEDWQNIRNETVTYFLVFNKIK